MAAWRDIEARAERLGATAIYQGKPATWLTSAARAAKAAPVIVNVKGVAPDNTPVLLTLAELERLYRAVDAMEQLRVLVPDLVDHATIETSSQ